LEGCFKEGGTKEIPSDKSGIRHAMSEVTTHSLIDAKYMLVSCSAFINYLVGKMAELKIAPKEPDEFSKISNS
jgi:hypothetical protein